MQKYRLRRQALETAMLREFERTSNMMHSAEMLLEPPAPPRVSVEADANRVRPAGATAVTVLAFCNFESPHCARLQVTLAQVLPLFPGVVRYAERTLPLEYHRHAAQAAEAAHCALEQGNYWRFHDVLYAGGSAPDRPVLERAARASDLEPRAFAECLGDGRHAKDVTADVAVARSLGVSTVPAVFVNGLYASPDVRASDLVWLIERELATLETPSPRLVAATTAATVPFQLRHVLVSRRPGRGWHCLRLQWRRSASPPSGRATRSRQASSYGASSTMGSNYCGTAGRNGWVSSRRPSASRRLPMENPVDPDIAQPHRAIPVMLDRDRVLVLLSDRIALARALQPVPMTAGGHRLLKLQDVAPGSLYEVLGLQPGDVIVGVNEQPVTEAFNPLWDALEKEDEVRLRVIRRGGLAQHYTYRFGE